MTTNGLLNFLDGAPLRGICREYEQDHCVLEPRR